MHLHFASSFGFENVYPPLSHHPGEVKAGELHIGLKGLLEWFELHLGYVNKDINDAVRIAHYRKAVKLALDADDDLFFAKSFQTDDWATSQRLLLWRDDLILSTCDFTCSKEQSQRLYALKEIEQFTEDVPPGVNDRWVEVLSRLVNKRRLPLDRISVYEPQEYLHPFFRNLFEKLQENGVGVDFIDFNYETPTDSDLDHFRRYLLEENKIPQAEPKADGSLVIVEADNETLIATAIAEAFSKEELAESLLIIPERGEILEEVLTTRDLPALGYTALVSETNLDQLFMLISLFLWNPIDAEKLGQYLSLPLAPITNKLRSRLAESFAEQMGVGSKKWNKTIGRYIENHPEQGEKIKAALSHWFDRKRFDPENGAPSSLVRSLYMDLQTWAEIMANNDEVHKNAYSRLAGQCRAICQLVEIDGREDIPVTNLQLQKWLKSLESEALQSTGVAESGSPYMIPHHANITNPATRVIWWQFAGDQNPIKGFIRWSAREQDIIGKEKLMTREHIIDLWYWQLKHAVLMSGSELLICIPKKKQGQETEDHPFLNDIKAAFNPFTDLVSNIDITQKTISIGKRECTLQGTEELNTPVRFAQWKIDYKDNIDRREYESYSSLSKLFIYPYSYFLNYICKIRPVSMPQVVISPLLKGKLSHRIFEEIFKLEKDGALKDNDFNILFDKISNGIIQKEGSVFLLPKNKIACANFLHTVKNAVDNLLECIRSNNWTIKGIEQRGKNHKHSIQVTGYIDLILERKREIAIVDLKWGGYTSRIKELNEERELQLVLYTKLQKEEFSDIHLAYYIITHAKLLSRNKKAFRQAITIRSVDEEKLIRNTIWTKMVNTYQQRWKEFDEGHIEVGDGMFTSELESDIWDPDREDFVRMPQASKRKKEDMYNEYRSITGAL